MDGDSLEYDSDGDCKAARRLQGVDGEEDDITPSEDEKNQRNNPTPARMEDKDSSESEEDVEEESSESDCESDDSN